MRLRLEFTTEPFDLEQPPPHALVARDVVRGARLDAIDVGPFGNSAEGSADAVLAAVDALLRRTLAVGATRISFQVTAVGAGAGEADAGEADGGGEAQGIPAAGDEEGS